MPSGCSAAHRTRIVGTHPLRAAAPAPIGVQGGATRAQRARTRGGDGGCDGERQCGDADKRAVRYVRIMSGITNLGVHVVL